MATLCCAAALAQSHQSHQILEGGAAECSQTIQTLRCGHTTGAAQRGRRGKRSVLPRTLGSQVLDTVPHEARVGLANQFVLDRWVIDCRVVSLKALFAQHAVLQVHVRMLHRTLADPSVERSQCATDCGSLVHGGDRAGDCFMGASRSGPSMFERWGGFRDGVREPIPSMLPMALSDV